MRTRQNTSELTSNHSDTNFLGKSLYLIKVLAKVSKILAPWKKIRPSTMNYKKVNLKSSRRRRGGGGRRQACLMIANFKAY